MPAKTPAAPPRMTWGRALPVLAVCIVFDALRLLFEMFWFFGPALFGIACATAASGYVGTGIAGLACGSAAGVIGFFGVGPIETFGIIMAIAIGLFGWMTVTLMLAVMNPRIWKTDVWGFARSLISFGVSEAPLLGALPMLTVNHALLYRAQIQHDKKALAAYKKTQLAAAAVARKVRLARTLAAAQREARQGSGIPEPAPEML